MIMTRNSDIRFTSSIHINEYGDKHYYKDKAMTILHREDGPAIERADGSKFWYISDEYITGDQFDQQTKPVAEITLEDIAASSESM